PAFPYVSPQFAFLCLSLAYFSRDHSRTGFCMLFDSPCGLKRLFIPASTLIQVRRFTLRKTEGGASGSAKGAWPCSPPLDRTASRKSRCAHRVVSKHTLSDRIFRVLYGPRGSKTKKRDYKST